MTRAPLLLVVVVLLGAPRANASATSAKDTLARAVRLFENFEDEKARAVLDELLLQAPPRSVAAKAHLYLGLIALNQTDSEAAKAEFMKAVRTDVVVDLPPGQSPKALILFGEARSEIATAPLQNPGAGPVSATAAENRAPSHGPAYILGGIGVASLVAGGIFGFLQQQAKSSVGSDSVLATAQSDAQPYAQDGLVADVLFGMGGAALVTAVILFFTEGSSSTPPVAVSAGPGGFAVWGRF